MLELTVGFMLTIVENTYQFSPPYIAYFILNIDYGFTISGAQYSNWL